MWIRGSIRMFSGLARWSNPFCFEEEEAARGAGVLWSLVCCFLETKKNQVVFGLVFCLFDGGCVSFFRRFFVAGCLCLLMEVITNSVFSQKVRTLDMLPQKHYTFKCSRLEKNVNNIEGHAQFEKKRNMQKHQPINQPSNQSTAPPQLVACSPTAVATRWRIRRQDDPDLKSPQYGSKAILGMRNPKP